jgi:hypothetical protein
MQIHLLLFYFKKMRSQTNIPILLWIIKYKQTITQETANNLHLQSLQTDLSSELNFPVAQFKHSELPIIELYLPAGHKVQFVGKGGAVTSVYRPKPQLTHVFSYVHIYMYVYIYKNKNKINSILHT